MTTSVNENQQPIAICWIRGPSRRIPAGAGVGQSGAVRGNMRSRGPLLPTKRAVRVDGRKRVWLPWALLFVSSIAVVYFLFLGTDHEDGTARLMRETAARARLSRLERRAPPVDVEPAVVATPKGALPDPSQSTESKDGQWWKLDGGASQDVSETDPRVPNVVTEVPDDAGLVDDIQRETSEEREEAQDRGDKYDEDEYRRVQAEDTAGAGVPNLSHNEATGHATRKHERVKTAGTETRASALDEHDGSISDDTRWSEEQCDVAAREWVEDRERDYAARMAKGGKSDLLFFLHIPRTAGRSFHFCYLKLATPERKRCDKSYDELRMDPHDPHCEMLATHDDYSLVERFDRQPKIVTMLRDPVARFLSSYEFAVEVSVRSFGNDVHTTNKQRVSTREIWPWEHCVRHIDNDLRSYKKRVDEDGVKDSISNVYNNSVYTPLHEFVELPMAHDDLHNGQFMQLMGMTSNASPETEPHAHKLRECVRENKAVEVLFDYAKRRLREEIDVTVVHERLDDSLRYSSAALGMHMSGPSYVPNRPPPRHTATLKKRMARWLERNKRDVEPSAVVGFVFNFDKLTGDQLEKNPWRQGYERAMRAALAIATRVSPEDVAITPHQRDDWRANEMGFQIAIVRFPAGYAEESPRDPKVLSPDTLLERLREARRDESDAGFLVDGADGFDAYGTMNILAEGRATGSKETPGTYEIVVDDFGTDPEYMPLGQRYRECERAQKRKYSRLKTKAFRALHQHVEGEFEPFVKEDRRLIPSSLIDKIREINHLDVRLHDFALELFDERVKESAKELDDEKLPPRLPI